MADATDHITTTIGNGADNAPHPDAGPGLGVIPRRAA